jgi:hypothetical protein
MLSSLSSSSSESYSLSYPTICKIHILNELENAHHLDLLPKCGISPGFEAGRDLRVVESVEHRWRWNERLRTMSDSTIYKSTVLAIRRFLFQHLSCSSLLFSNWLQYYEILLQKNHYETARYALQNAKNLCSSSSLEFPSSTINKDIIRLKECQLFSAQNQISKAIQLIEPKPIDLSLINTLLGKEKDKQRSLKDKTKHEITKKKSDVLDDENRLFSFFIENQENRFLLAEKLLLGTKLMIQSQQLSGSSIIQRFSTITQLNKGSDTAFYEFAKYYEFLYNDLVSKDSNLQSSSPSSSTLTNQRPSASASSSSLSSFSSHSIDSSDDSDEEGSNDRGNRHQSLLYKYMEKAVEKYANSLYLCKNPNLIIEILPKLLTLWLSFTAQIDPSAYSSPATVITTVSTRTRGSQPLPSLPVSSAVSSGKTAVQLSQEKINQKIAKFIGLIPSNIWFVNISQIVSRILHPNSFTSENLSKLLLKIFLSYPKQSIWHIASLMFSYNKERKTISHKLLNSAYKKLKQELRNEADAAMIVDSQKLFSQLITLAAYQTKEKKISFKLDNVVNLKEFLIPTKDVLLHSYHFSSPSSVSSPVNNSASSFHPYDISRSFSSSSSSSSASLIFPDPASVKLNSNGNDNFLFIKSFHESVSVAASKAKPKTIVIESICGKKVKFLCKMEKDGDLRKDAHMMEFNHTVNRLLLANSLSRQRKLRLRTYAVVCLNEESGLLEWVNHTECFRQAVADSHSFYTNPLLTNTQKDGKLIHQQCLVKESACSTGKKKGRRGFQATDDKEDVEEGFEVHEGDEERNQESRKTVNSYNLTTYYPHITYREVYQSFIEYQQKYDDNIEAMTKSYRSLIHEVFHYHPAFHRWFLERFPDPTTWLTAREIYSHSVAVWSAVGYIVGLGDRHTENILLDVTNGEVVHVDFDCLFDKGLTLAKPEIIPFRLTSNMIDGMGIMGIEGMFRQSLEISLKVLRDNRETLLNVLEPFLRDPTVAWSRSGRAQRTTTDQQQSSAAVVSSKTGATTANQQQTAGKTVFDAENKEAKEMLFRISDRLKGVYNLIHPHRDKFIHGSLKRREPLPSKGIGPSKDELLPLSVSGQAEKLIEEATVDENFAQLYIGKKFSSLTFLLHKSDLCL